MLSSPPVVCLTIGEVAGSAEIPSRDWIRATAVKHEQGAWLLASAKTPLACESHAIPCPPRRRAQGRG